MYKILISLVLCEMLAGCNTLSEVAEGWVGIEDTTLHGKYYWGFYGSYKHGNYSYGKKDGVWTDINNGNITKVTFKDGIEISSE